MLPEKFAKEEQWRPWRVHAEDYSEEIKPGMKDMLEKVRKLKAVVTVDDVGQKL